MRPGGAGQIIPFSAGPDAKMEENLYPSSRVSTGFVAISCLQSLLLPWPKSVRPGTARTSAVSLEGQLGLMSPEGAFEFESVSKLLGPEAVQAKDAAVEDVAARAEHESAAEAVWLEVWLHVWVVEAAKPLLEALAALAARSGSRTCARALASSSLTPVKAEGGAKASLDCSILVDKGPDSGQLAGSVARNSSKALPSPEKFTFSGARDDGSCA